MNKRSQLKGWGLIKGAALSKVSKKLRKHLQLQRIQLVHTKMIKSSLTAGKNHR